MGKRFREGSSDKFGQLLERTRIYPAVSFHGTYVKDLNGDRSQHIKLKIPYHQKKTPTLREAMRMVASLGGFLGRKSDGNPGTKSLWLGLQQLDVMTAMWKITTSEYISTRGDPLCPV